MRLVKKFKDLGAVIMARTQDIKQLGQVIVSVFKGEILPSSLGDMAAGITNVIGPNLDSFGAEEQSEQVPIEAVSNTSDKSIKDDLKSQEMSSLHLNWSKMRKTPPFLLIAHFLVWKPVK